MAQETPVGSGFTVAGLSELFPKLVTPSLLNLTGAPPSPPLVLTPTPSTLQHQQQQQQQQPRQPASRLQQLLAEDARRLSSSARVVTTDRTRGHQSALRVCSDLLTRTSQLVFVQPDAPAFVWLAHELAWAVVYDHKTLRQLGPVARERLEREPMLWRHVKDGRDDGNYGADFHSILRCHARLVVQEAAWGDLTPKQRAAWARQHLCWDGIADFLRTGRNGKNAPTPTPTPAAALADKDKAALEVQAREAFLDHYFGSSKGFDHFRRNMGLCDRRAATTAEGEEAADPQRQGREREPPAGRRPKRLKAGPGPADEDGPVLPGLPEDFVARLAQCTDALLDRWGHRTALAGPAMVAAATVSPSTVPRPPPVGA